MEYQSTAVSSSAAFLDKNFNPKYIAIMFSKVILFMLVSSLCSDEQAEKASKCGSIAYESICPLVYLDNCKVSKINSLYLPQQITLQLKKILWEINSTVEQLLPLQSEKKSKKARKQ
jgi:hypothetical protein